MLQLTPIPTPRYLYHLIKESCQQHLYFRLPEQSHIPKTHQAKGENCLLPCSINYIAVRVRSQEDRRGDCFVETVVSSCGPDNFVHQDC